MGLDTTHDAWHGAYSAFSRWRDQLAMAAGYQIAEYPDAGPGLKAFASIDWGHAEDRNYYGEWDQIPCGLNGPDPLLLLIVHSDCDGHLEPDHCALLADRLDELLPLLPEGSGGGHIADWRVTTQRFIDGCRAAAEAGERLEFH